MSDNSVLFETALKSAKFLCESMDLDDLRKAYKLTCQLVDNIVESMYEKATNPALKENNSICKTSQSDVHSWTRELFDADKMKSCQTCKNSHDETRLTRGGCSKCPHDSCGFCSENCFDIFHQKMTDSSNSACNKENSSTDQNLDLLSQLPDVLKANLSSLVNNSMFMSFGNNLFQNQNFMNPVSASSNNPPNPNTGNNEFPSVFPKTRGRPRGSSMIASSLRKSRGRHTQNNNPSRLDATGNDDFPNGNENNQDFGVVEVKRRGRPPINGYRSVVTRGRVGRPPNSSNSMLDIESSEMNKNCSGLPSKRQCSSPDTNDLIDSKRSNCNSSPKSEIIQPKTPNSNVSNASSNHSSNMPVSTVESVLQSLASQNGTNSSLLIPFIGSMFDPALFNQATSNPSGLSNALDNLRMPVANKNE